MTIFNFDNSGNSDNFQFWQLSIFAIMFQFWQLSNLATSLLATLNFNNLQFLQLSILKLSVLTISNLGCFFSSKIFERVPRTTYRLNGSWTDNFWSTFYPTALCHRSIAFWHWKAIELSSKYYILHSEPKLIIPFGNCWGKTRLGLYSVDFKNIYSSFEKKCYFSKIINNSSK